VLSPASAHQMNFMSTKYTCIKCGLATTARHRPENCFKGGYHEWVAEQEDHKQPGKHGTEVDSHAVLGIERQATGARRTQAA